ncbi:MAG: hypothetical protein JW712_04055 [Dehalococcoidales bacterium]|nr:hypothetical protein [Dehalococcoidales bacterium]
MAEPKYAPYVRQNATRLSLDLPERVHYPFVHMEQNMWEGLDVNCNFACSCVQEPFVMPDLPHAHPYDELLYFIGSDPDNPEELNAVVEIGVTEGWQKLTFTKTAVLHFRPGLQHAPVYVKKVDRPFFFGHVMQSLNYMKMDDDKIDKVDKVEYGEVIKHPVFEKTPYGTELKFKGIDHGANDAGIYFYNIGKPGMIERPEEMKGYNECSILMGGHPMKIPEFTAEAQICLGSEEEIQVVNSTTVIHVPADLPARPVNFTKVESPVCMMSIFVPPDKK